jgi:alpha-glucosidase
MGDLPGITARLRHVADLGVDGIWLSPFYPSPQADGGYDVADYRDVDPMFGTLDDADELIRTAHELGLRVIFDIVPNHTSDQHAWFQSALAAGPGSPERARFVFRDGRGPGGGQPPNDWQSVFGGPAWERVADGQWYLHLFAPEQPDLDWTNRDVREEFVATLRFWLDRGVDGFRIDVAHGLAKDPALPDLGDEVESVLEPTKRINHPFWDRSDVLDVYEEWRRVLDEYDGDRMLVAEAWVANPRQLARYVAPGRLHTAFTFDVLKTPWRPELVREQIVGSLAAAAEVGAPSTWVLSNHDVVRHVTRYGGRSRPRAASPPCTPPATARSPTSSSAAAGPGPAPC